MSKDEIFSLIKEKTQESVTVVVDEDMPSFVPYNLLTQHSIPDKSIADCAEALIGAYLIACGPLGALRFMTWLGIQVLPPSADALPTPASPMAAAAAASSFRLDPRAQLAFHLQGYDAFESVLGYRFRDRSYLLQAFCHASYFPNRLTDCYQRLEFLGDAVLDYLVTRFLYEDPRKHSPGTLTDLRSALVNNTIFATLAVKFQFHKYFKHFSPGLQQVNLDTLYA
jgi:endoribonuclease Dicer